MTAGEPASEIEKSIRDWRDFPLKKAREKDWGTFGKSLKTAADR